MLRIVYFLYMLLGIVYRSTNKLVRKSDELVCSGNPEDLTRGRTRRDGSEGGLLDEGRGGLGGRPDHGGWQRVVNDLGGWHGTDNLERIA